MEQYPPSASVPPNWVHPDLKRHMMARRRRDASARIEALEVHSVSLNACALETSRELHRKRHRLAVLEQQVHQARSEIASLEADESEVQETLNVVASQLTHHRFSARQLRSFVGAPNQSFEVLAGEEVASASEEPFTVNLEPFFGHLLWHPFTFFAPTAHDDAAIALFLRHFAPLFCWHHTKCTVQMVEIDEKPCLMETDTVPCDNSHCRYLHRDQLQHVRRAVLPLLCATSAFHIQDQRIDCVAELLSTWRTTLRRCRSTEELVSATAQVLRYMIGLGWHTVFTARERVWRAPLLARPGDPASASSTDAPPALVTQPVCRAHDHLSLSELRCEAERDGWRAVLECAELNIPAAQLFVDTPDAIMWRCMIRTAAQTTEQRIWLARRGIEVYPGSPHLQLHYVLALLDAKSPPRVCVDACLQAVSALSAQTCACASIPGAAALAVAATVSRYTAYAVARCALYLATGTDTGTDGDAAVNTNLVEALLTTVLKNDGREAALLPTATVNLTLMLVSLKQTNSLAHMDVLPLGAISDQVFTLTKVARSRPQDGCTQQLNSLLGMLSAMHRDELSPALVATLKAAVQVSLARTFSVQLHFVEQIIRKSSVTADIVLSALWGEYVRCVGFFDSTEAATDVAMELLQSCGPHPPCLCTVVLINHLGLCGDAKAQNTITRIATEACEGFEARFPSFSAHRGHSPSHDEEDEPVADSDGEPVAVELAAYHVLRAQILSDGAERLRYLDSVPMSPLSASCDAVVLLLLARLKLCAAADDDMSFRRVLRDQLTRLREAHLLWWSPLDVWYEDVIGIPHLAAYLVYRAVPALLGARAESTTKFREAVLDVSADLHVVHPLLYR